MRFFTLILFPSLFFANLVRSQTLYTLGDCFDAAKKNNIALQKSRNDLEETYIDKNRAVFNLFPSATASAEHIFSGGKNIDPVTNNFVKERFSGGVLDMTLQLNIFSGFSVLNSIKASLYKIKAGEYAYQKALFDNFSAITIAYAKAILSMEQTSIIRNNYFNTNNELHITEEKINVGKLSKSEYYTINTRYKSEQADLVEAQNDSLNAIKELKYLIGLDYHSSFGLMDIDESEIANIANKNFTFPEILAKVLNEHPALLESIFNEKAAATNLKAVKGNLFPSISLTGDIFSNYNLTEKISNGSHIPLSQQLNNNLGQSAGVLLQIPLFNKYQNRFLIQKEKINLTNARLTTKEIKNEIIKDVQQLINDFISAKEKYFLQTSSLQQGQLSYQAFEERYKLGLISSLELITAKDQFYTQQVKASQAKYNLYFKYKLLELLMNIDEL